jgi:hypothetical protein
VPVGHRCFFFPVVLLFIRFPQGGFTPLSPNLDSRLAGPGFPRFAKIIRPKRKLPVAPASAGGFFSCGFGTHRQMRMYPQIFSSAREKFIKPPTESKNSVFARRSRLVSVLDRAGGMREETLFMRATLFFGAGQARRAPVGAKIMAGVVGFPDWGGDLPRGPGGLREIPAMAGTGPSSAWPVVVAGEHPSGAGIAPALGDSKTPIAIPGGRKKA